VGFSRPLAARGGQGSGGPLDTAATAAAARGKSEDERSSRRDGRPATNESRPFYCIVAASEGSAGEGPAACEGSAKGPAGDDGPAVERPTGEGRPGEGPTIEAPPGEGPAAEGPAGESANEAVRTATESGAASAFEGGAARSSWCCRRCRPSAARLCDSLYRGCERHRCRPHPDRASDREDTGQGPSEATVEGECTATESTSASG